jgi:hypothetical protein
MAQILRILKYCFGLVLLFASTSHANDSALAIVGGGVQSSEDAPFVSTGYQFLPGDYIYVTFRIAGFAVQADEEKELRAISLTYALSPVDSSEIALAEPSSGEIKTRLSNEDKNWIPTRRASFLLPSFVAAGEFHIHLVVRDLIGKSEATKDFPFRMGGVRLEHSDLLAIENLRFSRDESGQEPLQVPAYRPGDTVYCNFDMAGFKLEGKKYHVAYGVNVRRPDGKPFLDEPNAAQMSDSAYYPPQFVPGSLNVITSAKSPKGMYTLLLTVRDMVGNTSAVASRAFTLE